MHTLNRFLGQIGTRQVVPGRLLGTRLSAKDPKIGEVELLRQVEAIDWTMGMHNEEDSVDCSVGKVLIQMS